MKFWHLFRRTPFALLPDEVVATYLPSWFVDVEMGLVVDRFVGPQGSLMLTSKHAYVLRRLGPVL